MNSSSGFASKSQDRRAFDPRFHFTFALICLSLPWNPKSLIHYTISTPSRQSNSTVLYEPSHSLRHSARDLGRSLKEHCKKSKDKNNSVELYFALTVCKLPSFNDELGNILLPYVRSIRSIAVLVHYRSQLVFTLRGRSPVLQTAFLVHRSTLNTHNGPSYGAITLCGIHVSIGF